MNAPDLLTWIRSNFKAVVLSEVAGNFFLFYSPNDVAAERRMPFVTVMVNDANDDFSRLVRPGVYRLNIGVSKGTFAALFAAPSEDDFTALDRLMPHPVYASSSWVCVVNPSPATLERARELIAEAYGIAVDRLERRGNGAPL